ncbi:hypothetical protein KJ684_03285 [Patescibacteria group bacterium]|nr:hypothetical protein [Patescibacteria group bacterium]
MTSIVQYMTTHGVPELSLVFFLVIPIAATVITFARQILGVKSFGLYIPLITTLAFLSIGIKYGVFLFVITVVIGSILRFFLRKTHLLYLPRTALTLITITICVYILFAFAIYFGETNFIQISVFPVLLLIILSEKFIATQIRLGNKKATIITIETLLLSIVSYYLITWPFLQNIVLAYPLITIVLLIVINVWFGKWEGLRLTEYFRFDKVIKRTKLPKK